MMIFWWQMCKCSTSLDKKTILFSHFVSFLAPTGAQGEAMLLVRACVRDIIQKNIKCDF